MSEPYLFDSETVYLYVFKWNSNSFIHFIYKLHHHHTIWKMKLKGNLMLIGI